MKRLTQAFKTRFSTVRERLIISLALLIVAAAASLFVWYQASADVSQPIQAEVMSLAYEESFISALDARNIAFKLTDGGNIVNLALIEEGALESLAEFEEVNLFLRGIVPLLGYDYATVSYARGKRFAGETKYTFKKMFAFAIEGITSFSIAPLRFIFILGLFSFIISVIFATFFFIRHFAGHTVSGWSSLIVSIWAIGGLQLLALGIIGEYIGKSYLETKKRPRYLVKEFLNK